MSSENLPQKRRENIFIKIKNWILKLFKNQETTKYEIDNDQNKVLERNHFKENIKVENKDKILNLQKKLKSNQIEISDLTDEELIEMIELYKSQIEKKKNILKQYRVKIAQSN